MTPHLTTHSTGARDSMAFIILPCDKVEWFRPRPVNSSVMSPLRVESKKSSAAPQLNADQLVWIMRAAG